MAFAVWHMHKKSTHCVERNASHVKEYGVYITCKNLYYIDKDNRLRKYFCYYVISIDEYFIVDRSLFFVYLSFYELNEEQINLL